MKRESDPWAPLTFAVTVLGSFVGLVLLGSVVGLAASGGDGSWNVLGYGSDDVCVSVPVGTLPYGGSSSGDVGFTGIRPEVSQSPTLVDVCDLDASAGQHALHAADRLAGTALLAGFLVLAALLIRAGRRQGTFTPQVARWLTLIGGYVVAGSLIVALLQAMLRSLLIATMTTGGEDAPVLMMFDVSVAVLVAGFGALTAGRVMARSVALQREVDTLV